MSTELLNHFVVCTNPACRTLFAGPSSDGTCPHCHGLQANVVPARQLRPRTGPQHAKQDTCLVCNNVLLGPSTRFCSKRCYSRGRYLYKQNPDQYPEMAPSYSRPDTRKHHEEVAFLRSLGAKLGRTRALAKDLTIELAWCVCDEDTMNNPSERRAIQQFISENQLGDTNPKMPSLYAAWRKTQLWAKDTPISVELEYRVGLRQRPRRGRPPRDATATPTTPTTPTTPPKPTPPPPTETSHVDAQSNVGVQCVCSLCDKAFIAPFQTDVCPACL